MTKYLDFLRQIVNPILAKYLKERKNLVSTINEIRRFLLDAEAKHGFSVFGGNPEKLKDYLTSNDFKLVINLFRSSKSLDILVEILKKAQEVYEDIPGVREAINKLLDEIRREAERNHG